MQAMVDEGRLEQALELFFREIVQMPEHELQAYRRLPAWTTRVRLAPTIPREAGLGRFYRLEAAKFADLQTPTLLLLGGDNPRWVREAVEMVATALPNSKVAVLPGQQHIAMDRDPDLFVEEVLRFLPA